MTDGRLPGLSGVPESAPARPASKASLATPEAVPSEPLLVARVLAGNDRFAFAELVRRHQSGVRSLLRRLTKAQNALADDLAQETFLQVHRNLRQFRGDARFATWIYRIAYNCFLAHLRTSRPTQELPDESVLSATEHVGHASATELRIDLERALGRLSDGEREAIIHCYFQDLSHEEAAYVMGCPLGTVKTNVLRGKQKLRELLADWSPHTRGEGDRR